jgi:putative nucleotidyltransferase with HDIG domain
VSGPIPSRDEAVDVLHQALTPGSDRLAHTLAVGRRAQEVVSAHEVARPHLVVAAAYLHDVGYADAAVDTGMHQLDGARYLRDLGYAADLCRLVAHHTFARMEARNTGLDGVLDAEFPHPDTDDDLDALLDVVTFCDLTTSHTGEPVTVDERFAGIYARYPADHVVTRTMREVEPLARRAVERLRG